MLKICCDTAQDVDSAWRMLGHVPYEDFRPVVVLLGGQLHYVVVRTAHDEQTAIQPGDQPGCMPLAA
jgi:hypothetical protein